MKVFSIAVAVTLVLTFVCILESSAVPFTGVQELEEVRSNDDTPFTAHQEMAAESWMMPQGHTRQKRHSHLPHCLWCCNCCRSKKGCGFCCRF